MAFSFHSLSFSSLIICQTQTAAQYGGTSIMLRGVVRGH